MTPVLLEQQEGFLDALRENGRTFQVDRIDGSSASGAGGQIRGLLESCSPIDPHFELGDDWREMATLETWRPKTPRLGKGGVLSEINPPSLSQNTPSWKIIRREDSPATYAVKFWLVKISRQDQQS